MLRQLYIGWIGLLIVCFAAKGATIPAVLIQNYSVKEYKASCQNWDLSVSYNGFIYAANNSGLLRQQLAAAPVAGQIRIVSCHLLARHALYAGRGVVGFLAARYLRAIALHAD